MSIEQLQMYESRASEATNKGALALERLLDLAETRQSGQIERIASFLGGVWNGKRHFDLYDLRALDVEISDDMLAVIDALRWAKVSIGEMVQDGDRRIQSVLSGWNMYGPEQTRQFICVRN